MLAQRNSRLGQQLALRTPTTILGSWETQGELPEQKTAQQRQRPATWEEEVLVEAFKQRGRALAPWTRAGCILVVKQACGMIAPSMT